MISARPRFATLLAIVILFSLIAPLPSLSSSAINVQAAPVAAHSFFGMNLYVTGLERSKPEKIAIMDAAQDLGVKWSREEMSWANLEPYTKGEYNWTAYDPWINELVKRGIGVVGTIQTTPAWASGASRNQPDWYWNAPHNPQDFVDFA